MIVDDRTAILLHFNEPATAIQPIDSAGTLASLVVPAGLTAPATVDGDLGRARQFGVGKGFEGTEAIVGGGKLLRSMTLEAVLSYQAGRLLVARHTIIGRGRNSGTAAERNLWSMVLVGSVSGATAQIVVNWTDASGFDEGIGSASFQLPANIATGGRMYIAATRHWLSTTEILVEFFVNGRSIGTATGTHGDLAGGDGGHTTVGYAEVSGSKIEHFLDTIDVIRVSTEDRSGEEIRQIYRRNFVYPDEAHEVLRALLPGGSVFGDVYSRDPSSGIQRELRVEAEGMAWGVSKAAELEEDFLPDRAWFSLARWEKVARLSSLSTDTFATRRARVVAHLRKVHGFQRSEILKALVGPLALTEAQLQLIEVSNQLNEDFLGVSIAAFWTQEPNAGTIGISGGKVDLDIQIGDDARWDGSNRKAVALRTTIGEEAQCEVLIALTPSLSENDVMCGAFISNTMGDAFQFGIIRDLGVNKWFYRTIIGGVATTTLGAAVPAGTVYWLRAVVAPGGATVTISRAVDPSGLPWTDDFTWVTEFTAVGTLTVQKQWAGPFVGTRSLASATANSGADVLAFRIYCPQLLLVYQWYVYRDPSLVPTTYDVKGAQLVVDLMKPAHTFGDVVEATAALCDSPYTRCDREPLGA
jgi:hypothetical protein